ncbi:MAG TPA: HD-GYP domain-containing protein [Thermaerobacter sp.]
MARTLDTAAIRPGAVLDQPVYDLEGRLLLEAGTVLTESHLHQLRRLGYRGLAVRGAGEEPSHGIVSDRVHALARGVVRKVFEAERAGRKWELGPVREVVHALIDSIDPRPTGRLRICDSRTEAEYLFAHNVQVCVLAVLVAKLMGLSERQQVEIGVGAILHDIGKIFVDEAILNKPGRLTEEEWEQIRRHPVDGFEILRRVPGCSILSAHIAYQHHERLDGSGYPRRLRGPDIHLHARICAVVDVFDALISDRPYRRALPVAGAMRVLREQSGMKLDATAVGVLDRWLRSVAPQVFAEKQETRPAGSPLPGEAGRSSAATDTTVGRDR